MLQVLYVLSELLVLLAFLLQCLPKVVPYLLDLFGKLLLVVFNVYLLAVDLVLFLPIYLG